MSVKYIKRSGLIVCVFINKEEEVPTFIKSQTNEDKNFIFESAERLTHFKEQKELKDISESHYVIATGNGMNKNEVFGYFDEKILESLRKRLITFVYVDLVSFLSMKERYGYWKVLGVYLEGIKDEAKEEIQQVKLYANRTFQLNDDLIEHKIKQWLSEELNIRNLKQNI